MGKLLAGRFPAARTVFDAVEQALEVPLSRIRFEGPEEELTFTPSAHPPILAQSASLWPVVRDELANLGAPAGHSLGEYSAYVTATALGSPQASKLFRFRGYGTHRAGHYFPTRRASD